MEQVNQETRKDNRKIWYLIIIIIILVGGSAIFYYFNRDKIRFISNPPTDQPASADLSQDFINHEEKLTADVLPPEDIKQRLAEQLQANRQEIADQEATEGGNPYFGYLGVANILRQLGDYQASEAAYLDMIAKFPDDELVWHNLGVLYEDMRQYLSAAEAYTTSLEKKPVEVLAHLKLAELYRKYSFHPEKAKEIYLQALQETDNDGNVLRALADYLERYQKDDREALLYWQEVLKGDPDNQAVKDRIAEIESEL